MLDSLIHLVSHSVEAGAAVSHSPQTAIAALLCAALVNFFN